MKVILIIQGEGSGHITQALAYTKKYNYDIQHIIITNNSKIDKFNIDCDYITKLSSFNFVITDKIDWVKTIVNNSIKAPIVSRNMFKVYKILKQTDYDLILNFYEILALPSLLVDKKVISISNQNLFFNKSWYHNKNIESFLIKMWTKLINISANELSSPTFDDPLLSKDVYNYEPSNGDRILVYLYNDVLYEKFLSKIDKNEKYDLYMSDKPKKLPNNVKYHNLNRNGFLKDLSKCKYVISSGGFQVICEAIYYGKYIKTIPLHYEQKMNTENLIRKKLGSYF
jgi:uncharacterized protein (TIGR00661 family)